MASAADLDGCWLLICFMHVFMMQAGFSLLEAGNVRVTSVQNVLFKNIADCGIGCLCWWSVGWALAYGGDWSGRANPFCGTTGFFFRGGSTDVTEQWLISFSYMTLAGTVISGAVAERASIVAYYCIVTAVCSVSYPLGVHWLWSQQGWLSPFNPDRVTSAGALDFAGSGVIHATAGFQALVCSRMIGPRRLPGGLSVFGPQGQASVAPHNRFLAALGTIFLWTCWYAFNGGSVASISAPHGPIVASNVVLTTTTSALSSVAIAMLISYALLGYLDVTYTCNSLLSGLVGITAGSAYVSPMWAAFIGAVSAVVYCLAHSWRRWMRVDDVIDAFAVHGACGVWGMVAVGFFADQQRIGDALPAAAGTAQTVHYGLLLGGSAELLQAQVLATAVLAAWSSAFAAAVCLAVRACVGLRVPEDQELVGVDIAFHQSPAIDYVDEMGFMLSPTAAGLCGTAERRLPSTAQRLARTRRSWGLTAAVLYTVILVLPHAVAAGEEPGPPANSSAPTSVPGSPSADEGPIDKVATVWVFSCLIFIFLMQAGFSCLEAGNVRSLNVQNILFKNVSDCCVAGLMWWATGYAIAYGGAGSGASGFMGNSDFFLHSHGLLPARRMLRWALSYAYLTTAGTIVSGAVAERISLRAYLVMMAIIAALPHPVMVHWMWSADGWLSPSASSQLLANGALDHAGGGVIHAASGAQALIAAWLLGPRTLPGQTNVFSFEGRAIVAPHNKFLAAVGTLLLWTSWYAFNGASGSFTGGARVAANVFLTTSLSAATAAVTSLFLSQLTLGYLELMHACNSILAGLVAITAGCAYVHPEFAVVIGFVAALVYFGAHALRKRMQVDDVIDAFAVHGASGVWGMLAVGLFADGDLIREATGNSALGASHGLLLGGGGEQLAMQLIASCCLVAWSGAWMAVICLVLKRTIGLRVPVESELVGLDRAVHKTAGYDYLEKIQDERDYAQAVVAVAEAVCDSLVRFDLGRARTIVDEARPRAKERVKLLDVLVSLLENLNEYKPYLPNSLFTEWDMGSADAPPPQSSSQHSGGLKSIESSQIEDAAKGAALAGDGSPIRPLHFPCATVSSVAGSEFGVRSPLDGGSSSAFDRLPSGSALDISNLDSISVASRQRGVNPLGKPRASVRASGLPELGLAARLAAVVEIDIGLGAVCTEQPGGDQVGELVRAFCARLVECTLEHRGTVQRVGMGHAVLTWVAVAALAKAPQSAVRCAMQLLEGRKAIELAAKLPAVRGCRTAAAVAYGRVLAGNGGAAQLRTALCWGPTVTATRRALVALARYHNAGVLIDARAHEKTAANFVLRPFDVVCLPPPVVRHFIAYQVLGDRDRGDAIADSGTNDPYVRGFMALVQGDSAGALRHFAAAERIDPLDRSARRMRMATQAWPGTLARLHDPAVRELAGVDLGAAGPRYAVFCRMLPFACGPSEENLLEVSPTAGAADAAPPPAEHLMLPPSYRGHAPQSTQATPPMPPPPLTPGASLAHMPRASTGPGSGTECAAPREHAAAHDVADGPSPRGGVWAPIDVLGSPEPNDADPEDSL
eukprot:TRINITY_DN1547_c3_g1_i1.p1 TRINITY_DN1547_c3_g1~~TRINITY_DN1547_c3_g1_i1.p1  ORF type:complete len:1549 (+),score=348.66 TRINITY_DN1547_c3_g1_i1:144-4790(+)